MIKPIKRPSTVAQAAADSIRAVIFRGEFKPGEPLKEIKLSEKLQVSRGTVREALRLLQDERLVEIKPRYGAHVSLLNPKIAEDLYKLRGVLEAFAVNLVFEKNAYSEDGISQLIDLAKKIDELENELEKSGQFNNELVEIELKFHMKLAEPCGHDLLLEELVRIRSLTGLFLVFAHQHWSTAYLEGPSHMDIVKAIQENDSEKAVDMLTRHIKISGETFLEQISTQTWEGLYQDHKGI